MGKDRVEHRESHAGVGFPGVAEVGLGTEDSPSHSAPEWEVVVWSGAPWSFIAGECQGKVGPLPA